MNHQIRILAEQATKKYDRLGNEIPFAQPDLEKFAELIVLKCAEIADTAEPFLSSDLIKQHFGVEE
jgi:hypothetical protein